MITSEALDNTLNPIKDVASMSITLMSVLSSLFRSDSFNCSTPSLDVNYPCFYCIIQCEWPRFKNCVRRTVTNAGEPQATYVASVTPMDGFEARAAPEKLVFEEQNVLSLKLSIERSKPNEGNSSFVAICIGRTRKINSKSYSGHKP
ncbi:hypothetical protein FEM48_Zijuj06G0049300 [Ziziphus jujuba var. spinosa]|uniref:Subtilisin-like protease fibronectin type-III domain-containing protein n=1 Tax=Ziziphus jujuba var. spinosa TaxID=714518 RepID=A0A978V7A4_ZIZJJ|nr:hypothetical protein FEM48_Zijuj06G0049300 [Ziziphus jujuba var. spinosa]